MENQININYQLVSSLNRNWPKRATVCSINKFQVDTVYEAGRPDYPLEMVPFINHPKFSSLSDEVKSKVITWGWIGYNLRTITAEEKVVNPALSIIADRYLAKDDFLCREALQHVLIDEHYHTLMHLEAVNRTKNQREINYDIDLPESVTYLSLKKLQDSLSHQWQKDLAAIAFAVVAEISVNAYLDMLADNQDIQPQNRQVAELHNRDEYAHSKTIAEIVKKMYGNMPEEHKSFFISMLPEALHAYIAQDYSMWKVILQYFNISDVDLIIADTRRNSENSVIMRDYSGLKKFASALNILDEIKFNFDGYSSHKEI